MLTLETIIANLEISPEDFESLDREREARTARFYENAKIKVGDHMECAACGKRIVKTTYHQKFCRSTNRQGQKIAYPCKKKFHDMVQPRGELAILA